MSYNDYYELSRIMMKIDIDFLQKILRVALYKIDNSDKVRVKIPDPIFPHSKRSVTVIFIESKLKSK